MNKHGFESFNASDGVNRVLDDIVRMSVAILCIMLIVPICSGKATPICTPLAFITNAGMLTAMAVNYFAAIDQLNQQKDALLIPDRFLECFPAQF